MAQFRQSGFDRAFVNGGGSGNDISNLDRVAIGVKSLPTIKQPRHHHHRRSRVGGSRVSIATWVSFLCFVLAGSSLSFLFPSSKDSSDVGASNAQEDDFKSDFLANVTRFTSVVQFGHGSMINGCDSRYWHGDDRRRDEDYNEEFVHRSNTSSDDIIGKGHHPGRKKGPMKVSIDKNKGTSHRCLYNEAWLDELKMYEKKYEASLRNVGQSEAVTEGSSHVSNNSNLKMENKEHDIDDENDGGIDSHDAHADDYDDNKHENEGDFDLARSR